MAKTTTKAAKVPSRNAKPAVAPIAKVTQTILQKLKALDIEQQLQADIAWCLGSYSYDNNPVGLYEVAKKALVILKIENAKKTKGITAKMITDIEKALTTK